jgi:hypothetical protein
MIKRLFLLILISFPTFVLATAQEPDTITINAVELPLNTNPLEALIETKGWQPPEEASIWSSNWRGYIAKWEVVAGNLILKEASILLKESTFENPKRKSILNDLALNQKNIIAKWYSGALIVPDGEMTEYVHMGYGSSYENYQVLRIKHGIVIEHLSFTAEQFDSFKVRKFQSFKETEKFNIELNKLVNGKDKWLKEDAIDFLQSFYAEYYLSI